MQSIMLRVFIKKLITTTLGLFLISLFVSYRLPSSTHTSSTARNFLFASSQEVEVEAGDGSEETIPNLDEIPIIRAAYTGDVNAVQHEINIGSDVNAPNLQGWTALIFAVENNRFDIIDLLLQAGADVNILERDGWSALMLAAYHANVPMVELLLRSGADPLVSNNNGYGAHSIAFFQGHHAVSNIIVNAGLVQSILRNNIATGLVMVNDGANVNTQTTTGWTLLMVVCTFGDANAAQKLLQNPDLDLNLTENDGWTALMFAVNNNHVEIVQWLLERGADVTKRSVQGFTAEQLATDRGVPAVQEVFRAFQEAGTAGAATDGAAAAAADGAADGVEDGGKKKKWGIW